MAEDGGECDGALGRPAVDAEMQQHFLAMLQVPEFLETFQQLREACGEMKAIRLTVQSFLAGVEDAKAARAVTAIT